MYRSRCPSSATRGFTNARSILVNDSSLALPPSLSQFVRPSVRVSQNWCLCPRQLYIQKRLGHKTPHPKKRPVTKLETPSRKKARSQNSRPHPEKRLGHKTREPIPKKGSVTKLESPSRKKAPRSMRNHSSQQQPENHSSQQQPERHARPRGPLRVRTSSQCSSCRRILVNVFWRKKRYL